ncbi:MAG: transposase family protein [Prevotellaceae bacterium]|nr:transposase family protein [Prevotellaceae bacterium]
MLCSPQKRILWLSRTHDGHVHDKKIADEQPLSFPAGITLWQDTGFLGHTPKNVTVKIPTKKPKGKELSEAQKKENKGISSFRILVEHAIGGVKRCRIVKDRFRCHKFGFDDMVMLIACGLHNFRIYLKYEHIAI